MAPVEDKTAPLPALDTADLPAPPKPAATATSTSAFDTPTSGLTPVISMNEKTIDVRRDSNTSVPQSTDNPFDTDIEAMITPSADQTLRRKSTAMNNRPDCPSIWPGRDQWKRNAKSAKRSRYACNCLASLSKRNRIIVKLLIILFIVGIAVGVGFGVSKSLNAPIWGDDD